MDWLKVLLISALPVSELRGGIPLALYLGFNPFKAYVLSVIGNIIPVPFLLSLLKFLDRLVKNGFYSKIVERTRSKKDIVEKYGYFGLAIFVAIPLPITGAWTGSLLAFLLGLDKFRSFLSIALGVLISGLIVLSSSLGIFIVLKQ